MSDPIARAFPARPLTIKAPISAWRAWLLGILGFLLFGGVIVVMSLEVLPVLSTDYQVRETAVALPKTRVESGRCQVRWFLLNDCEATLVIPQDRGPALRREVGYIFFEPSAGNRQVMPMGDPARPELTTTDLGLERFTNRVVTYAVLVVGSRAGGAVGQGPQPRAGTAGPRAAGVERDPGDRRHEQQLDPRQQGRALCGGPSRGDHPGRDGIGRRRAVSAGREADLDRCHRRGTEGHLGGAGGNPAFRPGLGGVGAYFAPRARVGALKTP
jgi:hypothetical protein